MLRVKSSALSPDEDGRLRYRGTLYSGLAYDVEDDGAVRAITTVENGRATGESTDWLELPEGGIRVDRRYLEIGEDYGPQLFQGEPLTGIAYSFGNGVCISEVEHVDGYVTEISQREWYENGDPRELIGGGEYTSWFRDGRLRRRAKGGILVYNLITSDDEHLMGLVLRDGGLFDLESVKAMAFEEELILIGGAVDAELLRTLRDHAGLEVVRQLRLVETGVGAEGVEMLTSLEHLRQLWLQDNPHLGADEIRRIVEERPDCRVGVEDTGEDSSA